MGQLVLFQYPGGDRLPSFSPPCLAVQLALRQLALPHRVVDLGSPLQARRVSPTGRVPALETGGRTVADSAAILDVLEERVGEACPWPREATERARDRLREHHATDTLYWLLVCLRWLVPANRDRLLDEVAAEPGAPPRALMRFGMVPVVRRRARAQGTGLHGPERWLHAFDRALELADDDLEGGPFLGGRETPGRGDLALAAHLAQVPWHGALVEPTERLRARPLLVEHVRRTFEACGAEAPADLPRDA